MALTTKGSGGDQPATDAPLDGDGKTFAEALADTTKGTVLQTTAGEAGTEFLS